MYVTSASQRASRLSSRRGCERQSGASLDLLCGDDYKFRVKIGGRYLRVIWIVGDCSMSLNIGNWPSQGIPTASPDFARNQTICLRRDRRRKLSTWFRPLTGRTLVLYKPRSLRYGRADRPGPGPDTAIAGVRAQRQPSCHRSAPASL